MTWWSLPLAALLVCASACTASDNSQDPQATRTPSAAGAELASQACGHRTSSGGPPPLTPIGPQWQPDIGAFRAAQHFSQRNAALAGQAAGRNSTWAPLASASRDLADIYATAQAEYAATLTGHATASEKANLRALQAAASTALVTINAACKRAI